jgi:hypothetical protein
MENIGPGERIAGDSVDGCEKESEREGAETSSSGGGSPVAGSPDAGGKRRRWRCSKSYKLRVLRELDAAQDKREHDEILRREGLGPLTVYRWRNLRREGKLGEERDPSGGGSASPSSEERRERWRLLRERQRLLREYERVQKRLDQTKLLIEAQREMILCMKMWRDARESADEEEED